MADYMSAGGHYPQHDPSYTVQSPPHDVHKQRLIDSFKDFTGNTVSQDSVALAKTCIELGGQRVNRYTRVQFEHILDMNKHTPSYLTLMTSAYDLLLKYVLNLLKNRRPQVWRSIKTNNTAFKARVSCMRGSMEILKSVGYTEEKENAMCFPEHVEGPDKQNLYVIAAELLMAKLEVEKENEQSGLRSSSLNDQPRVVTAQMYAPPSPQCQRTYTAGQDNTQQVNFQDQSRTPLSSHQDPEQGISRQYPSHQDLPPSSYRQAPVDTVVSGGPVQSYQQSNLNVTFANDMGMNSGGMGMNTVGMGMSSGGMGTLNENVQDPADVITSPPPGPPPIPRPRTKIHRPLSADVTTHSPQSTLPPHQSASPLPTPSSEPDIPPSSLGSQQSSGGSLSSVDDSENSSSRPGSATPNLSVSSSATDFLLKFRQNKQKIKDSLNKKSDTSFVAAPERSPEIQVKARVRPATESHAIRSEKSVSLLNSPEIPPRVPQRNLTSLADISSYKRPPNKKQPSFHDDPIREDPEVPPVPARQEPAVPRLPPKPAERSKPVVTPIPEPVKPQFIYCSSCKCKLQIDHKFCSYCGKATESSLPNTPDSHSSAPLSEPTPLLSEPSPLVDNPPLRASHQDALNAEKHHRTRVLPVSEAFVPVPREIPREIPPDNLGNQPELPPPVLPPKPKPRQSPPMPKFHVYSVQEPTPSIPPKPAVSMTAAIPPSGASGGSPLPPTASVDFLNMPGIAHLKEKEKYYQDKQRSDGVKEDHLERLDELVKEEDKFIAQQKTAQKQPQRREKKQPDPKNFPRRDLSQSSVDYDKKGAERLGNMARQGRQLLDSVKVCTRLGYSLDEIQVAFKSKTESERTLDYLEQEWMHKTEQIQRNLSLYTTTSGYRVGVPGVNETREALTKAGGNTGQAEGAIFNEREKRVMELLGKVKQMRAPGLSWEGAVRVLSANDMDVDVAFYTLQCDGLQPLYDYIFDENNKNVMVNQKEMEEIKKVITNKDVTKESHLRLLMAECKFNSEEDANIVLQLLEEVEGEDGKKTEGGGKVNYPLQHYVEAAKDHGDIDKAREFLIKECSVCYEKLPVHEFVAMPGCIHSICKVCFKDYFSLVIKEQEVKHFTCPVCGEPDMANKDITEGVYLEIFLHLIKEHLDRDCYKMCGDKLTDFNLMKEENFIWCSNTGCRSGFIHEGRALDVACPNCHKSMCSKCKKQWEPAHEGNSCDAFAKWKIDNDPNAQEQGLAAHLQANGIECPGCHFKYDLAKGGCMHFKCVRCPNEFCSGCGQSFKQGQACGKLDSCKNKGLHAHHPRDCLFYMRDFDVDELQGFLRQHKIPYDTEPKAAKEGEPAKEKPAEQEADDKPAVVDEGGDDQAAAPEVPPPKGCRVMLQKEKVDGLKDEECGGEVVNGHAGLCKTHYKEYLVDLINRNKLDPITMYPTQKIGVMLTREEMDLPDKDDEDDDDLFRDKLIEHVKQHLPLPNGRGQAAAVHPPDPQPPAPAQ